MKILNFLLLIFITNINLAQVLTQQEIEEVNDAVISNCGNQYSVSTIIPYDKIEKRISQNGFYIENTNALRNCFIFIAYTHLPDDEFNNYALIGIYKNGSIIWKSDAIVKWELFPQTTISAIMDLNKDGVIELVVLCYTGLNGQLADVWLLSWDGNIGWFINDIDERGYSVISQGDVNGISILDVDGDGVFEICLGDECYSWDGNFYSSSQPYPNVVPKDKLTASINCTVTKESGLNKFKYLIKNDFSSLQKIVSFGLDNFSKDITKFIAPENWDFSVWGGLDFLYGHVDLPVWDYSNALINPANQLGCFSFMSSGFPTITNVYIQGYNTEPDLDEFEIKLNSFITTTLTSSDLVFSLSPVAILDTLLNYVRHSFDLGWITNKVTTDKYDSLFNVVKTQLQQNNNSDAIKTLQTVLQQVDIDGTNNLTSEAYALFRYNTEYLLKRLQQ